MPRAEPANIPESDKDFIEEKAVDGFTAEEIHFMLGRNGVALTLQTVKDYLNLQETQERLELRRSIQEKKQELGRGELIEELRDQISILRERSEELRESENDEISNDTTKNLLKAIRQVAEMIDVLEAKDRGSSGGNVVNINQISDFKQVVRHMPRGSKEELAEQLAEDEDVAGVFVVQEDHVPDGEQR